VIHRAAKVGERTAGTEPLRPDGLRGSASCSTPAATLRLSNAAGTQRRRGRGAARRDDTTDDGMEATRAPAHAALRVRARLPAQTLSEYWSGLRTRTAAPATSLGWPKSATQRRRAGPPRSPAPGVRRRHAAAPGWAPPPNAIPRRGHSARGLLRGLGGGVTGWCTSWSTNATKRRRSAGVRLNARGDPPRPAHYASSMPRQRDH
jgi:hypothetical protein